MLGDLMRNRIYKFFVFIIGLLIPIILFDARIEPTIRNIAETKANNIANNIVDSAVTSVLEEENITYDNLTALNKDNNGKICSITSNIVLINTLKAKITDKVSKELSELEPQLLEIPIGSLIGVDATAGYGPKIRFNISLEGFSNADITNLFDAAGINQTRHQIMLNIATTVYIILPGSTRAAKLNNEVCVAETIIVGAVPETFASFSEKITQK